MTADRSWVSVVVAAVFVVSVSGVFAWVMRDQLVVSEEPEVVFTDDFESRSDDTEFPGGRWEVVDGTWSVDAGRALTTSEPDPSVVVTPAPVGSSVTATVGGDSKCGIVARFVDEDDYVALQREPEFGVWNLVAVDASGPHFLGNLPDAPSVDVRATITVGDRIVSAEVLDRSLTVVLDEVDGPVAGGLIGSDDAERCAWAEFEIDIPRG